MWIAFAIAASAGLIETWKGHYIFCVCFFQKMGVINFIVWLIVLFVIGWWISSICMSFYILFTPFAVCIPACGVSINFFVNYYCFFRLMLFTYLGHCHVLCKVATRIQRNLFFLTYTVPLLGGVMGDHGFPTLFVLPSTDNPSWTSLNRHDDWFLLCRVPLRRVCESIVLAKHYYLTLFHSVM